MSYPANTLVIKSETLQKWSHPNHLGLLNSQTNTNKQILNNLYFYFWFQNVLSFLKLQLIHLKVFGRQNTYTIHPIIVGSLNAFFSIRFFILKKFFKKNGLILHLNLSSSKSLHKLMRFFRSNWINYKFEFRSSYFKKGTGKVIRLFYKKRYFNILIKSLNNKIINLPTITPVIVNKSSEIFRIKKRTRFLRYLFIFSIRNKFKSLLNKIIVRSKLFIILSKINKNFLNYTQKYLFNSLVKFYTNFSSSFLSQHYTKFIKLLFIMILYKKIFLKKSLSIKKKKKIIEKKYKKIFKLVNKMYPNKKKKIKSFLNFWRSHLLNSLRLRFKNRFLKIVLKNFYKYMFFFYQHALRQHINIRLILFKYRMENMLQSALNKEINIIPYCFVITSYDKRYLLKKRKIQNINSRGPSFILDETGDISHQFYQPLLHNKAFAISFMLKKLWHRIAKKKRAKHFFRGKRVELFTYYIYYIIVGLVLQDIKIFTFAAAKHLNGLRSHKAFLKVWARFLKYSLRLLKGVTPFPIKGIYIVMSGRINEKDRARVRKIWLGPFPKLHHAGYYTDYCFTTFHGRRGDYGLKVWFTYFKYVKARKDEVQKIPEKQDSPL